MQIQRRFVRWQIDHPAKVKLEGAEVYAHCQVKNISLKGFQMALGLKLEKDKFCKMHLLLQEGLALEVEAWIVWHRIIENVNIYGFYFTRIKDEDKEKIYRFIRSNFSHQLNKEWWEGIEQEKGGEKMEDRRIFERFSARLPLRFLNLDNGKEGTAKTRDISAKGIGLVTAEQLAMHAPLEIWVDVPNGGSPLYSRAEVVWSKSVNAKEYWGGISLNEADLMGVARILKATEA